MRVVENEAIHHGGEAPAFVGEPAEVDGFERCVEALRNNEPAEADDEAITAATDGDGG